MLYSLLIYVVKGDKLAFCPTKLFTLQINPENPHFVLNQSRAAYFRLSFRNALFSLMENPHEPR